MRQEYKEGEGGRDICVLQIIEDLHNKNITAMRSSLQHHGA